jgi:phosphoribosylformylglycinamidine (FGAM) synthase-like enzyme
MFILLEGPVSIGELSLKTQERAIFFIKENDKEDIENNIQKTVAVYRIINSLTDRSYFLYAWQVKLVTLSGIILQ